MIKVKTFFVNTGNFRHHERLDNSINTFINENNVDVIDVKYSTSAVPCANGSYLYMSAMLIYKDVTAASDATD